MPTLQIRLSDELYAQVKANGGSPWARSVLEQAVQGELLVIAGDNLAVKIDAEPVEQNGHAEAPGRPVAPVVIREEIEAGLCERWMHHRRGVFCKTCGLTP